MTETRRRPEGLAAPVRRTPHGDGEHILFVDDDDDLRPLAARLIKRLGYRVSAFETPGGALAAFEAEPHAFDAVVTDFSMPDMRGDDLVRRMRAIRADLPVLMISGVAAAIEEAVIEAIKPVMLLEKPVSSSRLAAALSQALKTAPA